jgi:hypothetical protein
MYTDLLKEDTLQAVASFLTREDAGRLLAPLCKAGRTLVLAADAAEDAGQAPRWLAGPPMWQIDRVIARINSCSWPDVRGLAGVLRSLARMIWHLVEQNSVVPVFERREACAGRQASVLGCHRLQVLNVEHLLWHTEDWARRKFIDTEAHPTVLKYGGSRNAPKTLIVLKLLNVLGLRPRRGRDQQFSPATQEPLSRHREYMAPSLSARGWPLHGR